ncbi:MAG: type II toxin-antitoxin system VapC family toxin [Thermoplasmata archaeon]
MLIFDTSVIIDIERKNEETLQRLKKIKEKYQSPGFLSFISYFELMEGLKKQGLEDSEARELIEEFKVLKASKRTALELAELKIKTEKNGNKLPLADLLIAAQAKENNFVIVTKDNDFRKIDVRTEFI